MFTLETGTPIHNPALADAELAAVESALVGPTKMCAADLYEGAEIAGVGVLEADPVPLAPTHVRLYVDGRAYDKPADLEVEVVS